MGCNHPEALTGMCGMRLRHAVHVQTTSVFVKFLREASTFYALLTLKLQAAFGQLGFALEFPGLNDLAAATQQTEIPEFKTSLDCRISIYRCLICLGDLARWGLPLSVFFTSRRDDTCLHAWGLSYEEE